MNISLKDMKIESNKIYYENLKKWEIPTSVFKLTNNKRNRIERFEIKKNENILIGFQEELESQINNFKDDISQSSFYLNIYHKFINAKDEEEKKEIAYNYYLKDNLNYVSNRNDLYINDYSCKTCKKPNIKIDHLDLVCLNCGEIVLTNCIRNEYDNCSYEQRVEIDFLNKKRHYLYKRVSHLKDKLNALQNLETRVPDEIINQIILEYKKDRIERDQINPNQDDIRNYLRKLGYVKQYENISQIMSRLKGERTYIFNEREKGGIMQYFSQTEEIYEDIKPKTRKNFLNYDYFLLKVFELLDLPVHIHRLKKLKESKLKFHDSMWKQICEKNNWKFIPSL